ncbi:MAG TPA: hypothetical protein VN847_04020 [Streptosporangiaceae bacterium]|nr:hypothetical protein [Streptosporangiaceae bacterium]
MSSIAIARPAVPASHRATLTQLAVLEMRRYARHPLFLVGTLITVASCVSRPDHRTGSYFDAIVPAAALGVVGLVAMASLTRNSHKLSTSAGAPPVPEWAQTAALALAALVPFLVGIAWFAWAVWAAGHWPAPPGGFPFGPVGEGWKLAWLFALGALPALGGPLLGLVIGRWLPQRGVAPLAAVLLVAATILMQGLFEPLRRIRVIMPWTYFGGPIGIKGDSNRTLILSGSPQWYLAYLLCLCGLAVVAALGHDPEARSRRWKIIGGLLLAAAVATCLLAMWTGVGHTIVNPIPSSAVS